MTAGVVAVCGQRIALGRAHAPQDSHHRRLRHRLGHRSRRPRTPLVRRTTIKPVH